MSRMKFAVSAVLAGVVLAMSSCNRDLVDPAEQLAIDINAIDEYVASSGLTAYKHVAGLRFTITSEGTQGFPPLVNQEVKVKYAGRLLDGTEFDEGTTTNFVGSYILGWQYALPLMPNGTTATIYVPSGMGYGPNGYGPIPGNTVLVFDIEVQDVIVSASEKLRAQSDVSAIDQHLTTNSITAVADTTGVRYLITQQGNGEFPGWFTRVKFNYVGKVLTTGELFAEGTAEPGFASDSRVVDFIHGVKLALTKLSVGGKGTFYVPSGLAYGANANNAAPIPAHANVIYELELVEILPE